jgi:hypothetical protein
MKRPIVKGSCDIYKTEIAALKKALEVRHNDTKLVVFVTIVFSFSLGLLTGKYL